MAKLKKLSKSTPTPPEYEIEPFDHKDGSRVWLWACSHGCYDATPYDKTSRAEAEKLAIAHSLQPHD